MGAGERVQAGALRLGTMFHGSQGGPAARPDGTGKALGLYQLSLVDMWRSKDFALMGDAMFLSDRRTGPAYKPTQASWLLGAAVDRADWRAEVGREDHRPIGSDGKRAQAWRAGLHSAFGESRSRRNGTLPGGITPWAHPSGPVFAGEFGVDWYFFNKTLPARSDLSGVRHLVYSIRGAIAPAKGPWSIVGSLEAPTSGNRLNAVELEASYGAGWKWKDGNVTVTREVRDAVDRPGFNAWWQVAFSWAFGAPEGAL